MKCNDRSFGLLAGLLIAAGCLVPALQAGEETELKDEAGKTIARYIIEVPAGIAPAGTTDPAKQVGLIFCFQEHGTPTGNDLFPVRETLRRLGLSSNYILLAPHSQDGPGKFLIADHEPIQKMSLGHSRPIQSTLDGFICMAKVRAESSRASSL